MIALACTTLALAQAPVTEATHGDRGVFVVDDTDGSHALYRGGIRMMWDADTGVTFGDGRFAHPLHAAVPTATGWVFFAADGVVASASTFLGPLRGAIAPRPFQAKHDLTVGASLQTSLRDRASTDVPREPLAARLVPCAYRHASLVIDRSGPGGWVGRARRSYSGARRARWTNAT